MEKIAFLYTSPILPGKLARAVHSPEPWVKAPELPTIMSFDITFGLIAKTHTPYRVEVDVFYGNYSLLENKLDDSPSETLVAGTTPEKDYVGIENMTMCTVKIKNEGLHRVVATLYSGEGDTIKLHSLESYFFVSKWWNSK